MYSCIFETLHKTSKTASSYFAVITFKTNKNTKTNMWSQIISNQTDCEKKFTVAFFLKQPRQTNAK